MSKPVHTRVTNTTGGICYTYGRSLDDCGKADRDDMDDALYYALRALERESSGATPAGGMHVKRVWAAYRRTHRALGVSYLLDLETSEGMQK